MDTAEEQIHNGRFHWHVKYRMLEADEGVTIRLLGPVQGKTEELARFDCFRNDPHFHIAFYDHNTVSSLDRSNPLNTVLEKIQQTFPELIHDCGSDTPTERERNNHYQVVRNVQGRATHIDRVFGSASRR